MEKVSYWVQSGSLSSSVCIRQIYTISSRQLSLSNSLSCLSSSCTYLLLKCSFPTHLSQIYDNIPPFPTSSTSLISDVVSYLPLASSSTSFSSWRHFLLVWASSSNLTFRSNNIPFGRCISLLSFCSLSLALSLCACLYRFGDGECFCCFFSSVSTHAYFYIYGFAFTFIRICLKASWNTLEHGAVGRLLGWRFNQQFLQIMLPLILLSCYLNNVNTLGLCSQAIFV